MIDHPILLRVGKKKQKNKKKKTSSREVDGIEYSVTKYTVVGSYESFAPSQLSEVW